MVSPELTITLADFKSVLKKLKLVMKSIKKPDVLFSFDGIRLNISTQGMETSIPGPAGNGKKPVNDTRPSERPEHASGLQ
jgi:hypothetical protein